MALDMKQRYARLDMSKLPDSYTSEFKEIKSATKDFSDETMNGIFAENFNDMYELVEKKYPAAIQKGGTLKKEKPAKVKIVKAKEVKRIEDARDFLANLSPDQEKILESRSRKKLTESEIDKIEEIFLQTEQLDDTGLKMLLIAQIGLSDLQASKWVAQRDKFLKDPGKRQLEYSARKAVKKAARKGKKGIVKTRDDKEIDRKSSKNIGKTFYDENGKAWKCKGYNAKLDECILEDSDGKEISACIEEMYTTNPVTKRQKGNLVDDCKDTLKEAGYTVREHKAGTKKIKRSEPRPEKVIIKERVEETFTPIMKDLKGSEEKEKENKQIIVVLESIQLKFTTIMTRISNMADDNKLEQLKKILELLDEIVD